MASFFYKARDNSGKLYTGYLDANSKEVVASRLIEDKLYPISIEESADHIDLISWFKNIQFQQKITLDDMVLFCRQMYALTRSGIPIMRAVFGLAETTKNQTLKTILMDIGSILSRGNTLTSALKIHKDHFSPIFISMIHVGESTGNLDQAFSQLVHYLEMQRDTRKKVTSALRYPLMVIAAIFTAILLVNIFVIPSFSKVFEKFGSDLPFATEILLTTSNLFVNYWWMLLSLMALLGITWFRYIQTAKGAIVWDKIKLKIPIIGSILLRICLSRFTRTFSMLTHSGVPILQGIEISSDAIGNLYIEMNVKEMKSGIERGESLSRTANQSGMFPPLILQMIAVGEESGSLDSLLNDVSNFYDEETDFEVKQLSSSIEPILLVFMGAMILILALGIFLPLWDLSASAR